MTQIKKKLADGIVSTTPAHIEDNSPIEPLTTTTELKVENTLAATTPKPNPFGDGSRQTEYVSAEEKERRRVAHECEMTTGIFRNFEKPGSMHEFSMRLEKGPVGHYKLYDGKVHQLPRNVARYLNKHCWYPEHDTAVDEHGETKNTVGKKINRFAFDNGEYYDDEVLPSLIIPAKDIPKRFNVNTGRMEAVR